MKLFSNWSRQQSEDADVEINVSIIAYISDQYINEVFDLSIAGDAGLRDIIQTARKTGNINRDQYRSLRHFKSFISVTVNGKHLVPVSIKHYHFHNGDRIVISTPISGG